MKKISLVAVAVAIAVVTSACEKGDYMLKVRIKPDSVAAGGTTNIKVKTKAYGAYHLDPKGMVRISFTPSSDKITLDKTNLDQNDNAGDFSYSTNIHVAADAPKGEASVKANIMFMLCQKELCRMISEEKIVPFKIE